MITPDQIKDRLAHRAEEFPTSDDRAKGAFDYLFAPSRPENNWDMQGDYGQPEWILKAHNTVQEKQVFMFGTGPSLSKQIPLLKELAAQGKHTWSVNRMRRFKELPFVPLHHSIAEPAPVAGWGRAIYAPYDYPEVQNRIAVHWFPVHAPGWLWVAKAHDEIQVRWEGWFGCGDSLPPLPTAWASPLTCGQVACWLGYRELYYLGVDTSQAGQAWNVTTGRTARERNILAILECADRARATIEKAGRKIIDCTPGGRLNREGVLPYAELGDVLGLGGT